MLRLIPALLMVAFCTGANAQSLYKCTDKDGRITYSGAVCKEGEMKAIEVPKAPPVDPGRAAATLQRQRTELAKLEQERAKREALERRSEVADNTAAKTARCAAMRKDQQVAEENAERAPGFKKASMREQARLAGEALKTECPG